MAQFIDIMRLDHNTGKIPHLGQQLGNRSHWNDKNKCNDRDVDYCNKQYVYIEMHT